MLPPPCPHQAAGGKVKSFVSFCGGPPLPLSHCRLLSRTSAAVPSPLSVLPPPLSGSQVRVHTKCVCVWELRLFRVQGCRLQRPPLSRCSTSSPGRHSGCWWLVRPHFLLHCHSEPRWWHPFALGVCEVERKRTLTAAVAFSIGIAAVRGITWRCTCRAEPGGLSGGRRGHNCQRALRSAPRALRRTLSSYSLSSQWDAQRRCESVGHIAVVTGARDRQGPALL